jgi:hypothetical protein
LALPWFALDGLRKPVGRAGWGVGRRGLLATLALGAAAVVGCGSGGVWPCR